MKNELTEKVRYTAENNIVIVIYLFSCGHEVYHSVARYSMLNLFPFSEHNTQNISTPIPLLSATF